MNQQEKYQLVRNVGQECQNNDELWKLFDSENPKKPIAYDGFEPSGKIHICQGLMRVVNTNKLTRAGCHFIFWIADYFAYLNHKMGGDLEKIRDMGRLMMETWKACGLETDQVEFRFCSDEIIGDKKYWEKVLQLSTQITINHAKKCTQIMGRNQEDDLYLSSLFYVAMQAVDIDFLGVDICSLGMDQRKVNMLSRDLKPTKKPVILSHPMLLGLDGTKMSKSNPENAIFMDDTENDVRRKIKKAYCKEQETETNPVLEYLKYIIFPCLNEKGVREFVLTRKEKFGGNVTYSEYTELENDFVDGKVHPSDLKPNVASYLNELLEPVRQHFKNNQYASQLKRKIETYKKSFTKNES